MPYPFQRLGKKTVRAHNAMNEEEALLLRSFAANPFQIAFEICRRDARDTRRLQGMVRPTRFQGSEESFPNIGNHRIRRRQGYGETRRSPALHVAIKTTARLTGTDRPTSIFVQIFLITQFQAR